MNSLSILSANFEVNEFLTFLVTLSSVKITNKIYVIRYGNNNAYPCKNYKKKSGIVALRVV